MKRKLEVLIKKCIECPMCILNPNTSNPIYYCAFDDSNPIIKNTNKVSGLCRLPKVVEEDQNLQNSLDKLQLNKDTCKCPQGSICEFFDKNEWCQYGKI